MIGFSDKGSIPSRNGAGPGDLIVVSGEFGYSAKSLKILLRVQKLGEISSTEQLLQSLDLILNKSLGYLWQGIFFFNRLAMTSLDRFTRVSTKARLIFS